MTVAAPASHATRPARPDRHLGARRANDPASGELISRTKICLDGVALALAAGAAAALSVTSGLSSTLVGVMVAVALLPQTATVGIMLGLGIWRSAPRPC